MLKVTSLFTANDPLGHAPRNRYEEQAALLEHRQFTNYARSANKCRKVLSESIVHDALTIENGGYTPVENVTGIALNGCEITVKTCV